MADYIPFVNSEADCTRYSKFYSDAKVARVLLPRAAKRTVTTVREKSHVWADAGIDGYDCLLSERPVFPWWRDSIRQYKGHDLLSDAAFVAKPSLEKVKPFVFRVLDHCQSVDPKWITVPQLPVVDGSGRNTINRQLAAATGEWRSAQSFTGRMVLPLIFTHQDQLRGRTQWRKTLELVSKCFTEAGASAIWVVDSDLSDQMCRAAFARRFESLVRFHGDLIEAVPGTKIIAGPYWGMNIVLWAKRLCDRPAISLGTGYRYLLSGAFTKKARRFHVALSPLRRWVIASAELAGWLEKTLTSIDGADPARKAFASLQQDLGLFLRNEEASRNQVAKSYKEWFERIQAVAPDGRTLALYQDLSSAYVLGKQLPPLPKSEASGRDAGKVAEQLMLHCL